VRLARNRLGDAHADAGAWHAAIPLYAAAGNLEALAEAYYTVEDYAGLAGLCGSLPPSAPLLLAIGRKLASVGLTEAAAGALARGGAGKEAVDVCVAHSAWDRAVDSTIAH
jgi:WD repeat-containing protein 35